MKGLTIKEVNFLLDRKEFKDGIKTKAKTKNHLEHSEYIKIKFIHMPCVCYINELSQISVMSVTRLIDYQSILHRDKTLYKWRLYFEDGSVLETFVYIDESGYFGDGTKSDDWHEAIKKEKIGKLE